MISLLLVNYRSAELAACAVRTAREATCGPIEVIAVDNSCDAAEVRRLRDFADVVIPAVTNLGYAGAINLGRRSCSGEIIVVTNPDVTFAAGAIDALSDELHGNIAVAGPALYWDAACEWLLPPSDLQTGWQKLDEMLAARSRAWALQRDRRRFLSRAAFWELQEPRDVRALSGAVMAIRSRDFAELGGFDERFPLYFEETDFVRRAAALHRRIRYVPKAKCTHLYNQSAGQVADEAGARYAFSEARYLEKWNGPFAARFLRRMSRPPSAHESAPLRGPIELDREGVIVEASPLPSFATAAGHFPATKRVQLPSDVVEAFRGETIYLRAVVRRTGEVLATYAQRRS